MLEDSHTHTLIKAAASLHICTARIYELSAPHLYTDIHTYKKQSKYSHFLARTLAVGLLFTLSYL
jgi:hypothetical protein